MSLYSLPFLNLKFFLRELVTLIPLHTSFCEHTHIHTQYIYILPS